MINQYDMEPVWIEREDGQEMIVPNGPVFMKTEQLSFSEHIDILVEQVRDALSDKREQ